MVFWYSKCSQTFAKTLEVADKSFAVLPPGF